MINEGKQKVLDGFQSIFGDTEGVRVFFAPGRVNLIGEHTDYNGGHVLPCALTIGTYAAARKRDDELLRMYSVNFPDAGMVERNIHETKKGGSDAFSNYPLSVIWALKEHGYNVNKGLDIVFWGNMPYSSGLSSSASVEVLTGYICKNLFNLDIDNIEIAKISQYAENQFVGVNCGIMDQFSIAMGKRGFAIYLNTSSLEFEYIPVKLGDTSLIISCTNKKRGLADSKYNARREECEKAVSDINKFKKIANLGELTVSEFEDVADGIEDVICRARARHVVTENQRTVHACAALRANDIEYFGTLMNESHLSLKNDYEVTGKELDSLVFAAWEQEGVVGSRMTGAGFGGCTISLVKDDYVPSFIKSVGKAYAENTDYKADFYVVSIGDGPREL